MLTIAQMLQKIADESPAAEPVEIKPVACCGRCGWAGVELNAAGLCSDCQKTLDRGFEISQLAGRCASGAELGHGVRYHARLILADGGPAWVAECGAKPGRRSAGWSSYLPEDRVVTCPRCLKKLQAKNLII